MIGTSLNQYRIIATIGAGGMGEVFRARDTRLHREVGLHSLQSFGDRMRRKADSKDGWDQDRICSRIVVIWLEWQFFRVMPVPDWQPTRQAPQKRRANPPKKPSPLGAHFAIHTNEMNLNAS